MRQLLRNPPTAGPVQLEADTAVAARIIAGLGGGSAEIIDAELRKRVPRDGTPSEFRAAAEFVRDLVKLPWEQQKRMLHGDGPDLVPFLRRVLMFAYRIQSRAPRLYPWLVLELARLQGDWSTVVRQLAGADESRSLDFLSSMPSDELEALDLKLDGVKDVMVSEDRIQHLHDLVPKAMALRISREDEREGLRDLRYLSSSRLAGVEDAGVSLRGASADIVRKRIRTIRDSVSTDDVHGRINDHLLFLSLAVAEGVDAATLPQDKPRATDGFWVALVSNLAWAAAGLVKTLTPAGRFAAAVVTVASAVGASGTYQEVERRMSRGSPDRTSSFRVHAAEVLTSPFYGMRDDQNLLRSVVDELWNRHAVDRNVLSEPSKRDDIVWQIMFPGMPRDLGEIARNTTSMVEDLWSWWWQAYSGALEDEMPPENLFMWALVRSGVADKLQLGDSPYAGMSKRWVLPDGTTIENSDSDAGGVRVVTRPRRER